jgi:hypothetical protein
MALGTLTLSEGVTWLIDNDHAELLVSDATPSFMRDLCARMYVQRANRRYRNGSAWNEQELALV